MLFAQARDIPNPDRLIQRSGDDQIIFGMELSAHSVMVVSRHCADQGTILPIPYPYGLVVGAGKDPGQFVVKKNSADVIQMTIQREEASSTLV